ncbi:MAG: MTH938/NDUFAF3 family protein [Mariprofundus sp.]|nr:MTH938/NDUFAF3 family protein [Mariprofundus sp.]
MKGDISPRLAAGTLMFTGYDDDYLQVNQNRYTSGISIHQGVISDGWGPERLRDLSIKHLSALTEPAPEVLILGTGRLTTFPDSEILDYMAEHHIGLECMDSRSAARTYNILVGEGRTVSAAILLPGARK